MIRVPVRLAPGKKARLFEAVRTALRQVIALTASLWYTLTCGFHDRARAVEVRWCWA